MTPPFECLVSSLRRLKLPSGVAFQHRNLRPLADFPVPGTGNSYLPVVPVKNLGDIFDSSLSLTSRSQFISWWIHFEFQIMPNNTAMDILVTVLGHTCASSSLSLSHTHTHTHTQFLVTHITYVELQFYSY